MIFYINCAVLFKSSCIVEDIFIDDIHFITGGAICAAWWRGPYRGDEEGFVLVRVKGSEFDWEFVDYKWEVKQ